MLDFVCSVCSVSQWVADRLFTNASVTEALQRKLRTYREKERCVHRFDDGHGGGGLTDVELTDLFVLLEGLYFSTACEETWFIQTFFLFFLAIACV